MRATCAARADNTVFDQNVQPAELACATEGDSSAQAIPGVLEDYFFTGHAALDAWETTGNFRYFSVAMSLAETAIGLFYDGERGGFFDTPLEGGDKIGALSTRRKPLQDAPTPAGNPVAAALLMRLEALTGREDFYDKAKATLECFAGIVEHLGLYAASYALALRRMVLPPMQIVVVGTDALADELVCAALNGYAINKGVVHIPDTGVELPPTLAQTIPYLPSQAGGVAVVCRGFTCGLPVRTAKDLAASLATKS